MEHASRMAVTEEPRPADFPSLNAVPGTVGCCDTVLWVGAWTASEHGKLDGVRRAVGADVCRGQGDVDMALQRVSREGQGANAAVRAPRLSTVRPAVRHVLGCGTDGQGSRRRGTHGQERGEGGQGRVWERRLPGAVTEGQGPSNLQGSNTEAGVGYVDELSSTSRGLQALWRHQGSQPTDGVGSGSMARSLRQKEGLFDRERMGSNGRHVPAPVLVAEVKARNRRYHLPLFMMRCHARGLQRRRPRR